MLKSTNCSLQNDAELCGHGHCIAVAGSPLGYTCLCKQVIPNIYIYTLNLQSKRKCLKFLNNYFSFNETKCSLITIL